jgi:hypothetical protein
MTKSYVSAQGECYPQELNVDPPIASSTLTLMRERGAAVKSPKAAIDLKLRMQSHADSPRTVHAMGGSVVVLKVAGLLDKFACMHLSGRI